MRGRLLALILAAAVAAHAADREFDRVVSAIEHYYGVKRTHVPLMGTANLLVKVAHPAGAHAFRLAVFDDLPAISDERGEEDLDRFMKELGRDRLHTLVVTHARPDAEASYILAGEIGKRSKLLIASFERNQATVVEVELDLPALLKMLNSPEGAHRLFGPGGEER